MKMTTNIGKNFLTLYHHSKLCNSILSKSNFLLHQRNFKLIGHRSYLSVAYQCNDQWNRRLHDPLLKDIKAIEFFYELLRKHKKSGKIAAIDVDIFINSIHTESVDNISNEIEEALKLLRRTPETTNTLESTTHTAIRLLLSADKDDLIMKLISDPLNYGVFPDHYLLKLMMTKYLKKENYMAAARVASTLMLQEDYGSDLTKSLSLLCCFNFAFNLEKNQDWVHYNIEEEPEEEVKVLVKYIRNPYFDDHFDLRIPEHIVGKTLAWCGMHLEEGSMKTNAQVLGWALYEKWVDLEAALKKAKSDGFPLDERVISLATSQTSKCTEEEVKTRLLTSISSLNLKETDIVADVGKMINRERQNTEENEIKRQIEFYGSCERVRKENLAKQLEIYEREQLLTEIKTKKLDLKKREEVIFFFENEDRIEVELEKKREMFPEDDEVTKNTKEEEEEDYIPPEVKRR